MTARHLPGSRTAELLPMWRVLEGLSRIHRWILVLDEQRRVVWMSHGLRDIPGVGELHPGDDARTFLARLPRPEQVFPLRSNLRDRSHLRRVPLEIQDPNGGTLALDLDLIRLHTGGGDMLVVFASERAPSEPGGLDAWLIEALPDALIALDGDGFVRRANAAACRLLSCSAAEILARPIAALIAPGAEQIEALADALRGPARDARCEIRFRAPSARVLTLDVSVTPLHEGSRALVLRDVTSQRAAAQQLARTNEELDHCIGALAHDLRSPLVGLLGFSRLLRQDYDESLDDTGRHFVDRIEQAARTMESLIHELLQLARVGEPGERPMLIDCQAILRQLAAELKPRLEESGIELVLPSEGTSSVYCDRARLYQVLSNLIGNAIDHMGPHLHARIEVSVREDDEGHEIIVSDNGRGVDPADRERIFEIFQSAGRRADGRAGTGMGLAIVKKIVERRGGRIWLECGPEGGASFHATFPRH